MWVERYDENNNLMTGETDKFVDKYEGYSYTFDWFLGDSLEFAAFYDEYGFALEDILKSYRNTLPDVYKRQDGVYAYFWIKLYTGSKW